MEVFITIAGCLLFLLVPFFAQTNGLAAKSHRGKELMAVGRFEEAIPIYRDLVKALPNNPGPMMDLGLALHMAGHDREAVKQFQGVLKLKPHYLHAQFFLGATYLGLKEPARAIDPLKTVIRAQPGNKDARMILGEALLTLERFQPAAEQFQKLSELDPENPKAWNGLGLSYEGLANRNFEELEKTAPGSAYWLLLVAETRAKADQYKGAFFFYREALAKMPALRGVHAAVAEIYRKGGHPDWAAIEEEKERKMSPLACGSFETSGAAFGAPRKDAVVPPRSDHGESAQRFECDFWARRYPEVIAGSKSAKTAEAFFWRTRAYDQLALRAFSHLALIPPSAEAHELMAKIQFNRKNYSASSKEWQEALKLSPGNPYDQQGLATALSASSDYESARPLLESLIKRSPDSVELNYWLGFTLLGLEKPREAIPFLEKAVQGDPSMLSPQRDLARAYLRLGQVEKAIPHLEIALPIDDDGSLYYQLAQAYRRNGQKELESETLKKFKELQSSAAFEKKRLEQEIQITPP